LGALTKANRTGLPTRLYYFHTDINGAPETLTDSQGEIVWSLTTQVWGKTQQEEGEHLKQNLRFQGQYLDRETGLHYNTFRDYDPDLGRFTTPDPIGLAGGLNLYQYAPNPIMWVDPWGWACKASWNRARRQFWREEAKNASPGKYSAQNIVRMEKGLAPRINATIKFKDTLKNRQRGIANAHENQNISMELHHVHIPQRSGSTGVANQKWNLQIANPQAHSAMDKHRHINYDIIHIDRPINKF